MQDKQKVTLYLPPQLHRQLKIKSAIDDSSMSAMVERAVTFLLNHQDVVDELEGNQQGHGQAHRIYACPECQSSLVQRGDGLVALGSQPSVLTDDLGDLAGELSAERVREHIRSRDQSQDSEVLVTC